MTTTPRRPDYHRIAQLEQELGIGAAEPTRAPATPPNSVCLVKNCDGETTEMRAWNGRLIRRYHRH